MAIRPYQQYKDQVAAEVALNFPEEARQDFVGGFTGNHQSFGSWFTAGLTGLIGSKGFNEESQKNWYVQRNSVQFGKKQLESIIKSYEDIAKYRSLTAEESARYSETKRRNDLITRDLKFVFDNKGGNLDAPIDVKGQSFNQRWGVEPENEELLKQLVEYFKDNPSYMGGVFTAEILKDLPLSVLAWLGLSAKGATGFKAITSALNKLNNIQPKVLRGITKLGTGVAGGAAIGAGYETAFTGLEQGDVKSGNVKAGAAFGAVFGVLAGLGIMGRTAKDLQKQESLKNPPKDTPVSNVDEVVDRVLPKEQAENLVKPLVTMFKEHDTRLFPELRDGKDYEVISGMKNAKKRGVENLNKDKAAQLRQDSKGKNFIVLNERLIDSSRANLRKEMKTNKNKFFSEDTTANDIAYLKYNKDAYKAFLLAHELSHLKQNKTLAAMGRDTKSKTKEEQLAKEKNANDMAIAEMRRSYNAIEETPSDRNAREILQDFEGRARRPEEVPLEATSIPSRAADYLQDKPKVKYAAIAGAGALAYGLTDKEEGDPVKNVVAATLAVGVGPKLYKAATSKSLNKTVMEAKREVAQNIEVNANLSKQWEATGQIAINKLTKMFDTSPEEGWKVINTIEGKKNISLTQAQKDLVDDIEAILKVIGKEAEEVELIGNHKKDVQLKIRGKTQKAHGALLNSYFPHVFYNPHLLTELDLNELVRMYGKIDDKHALKRDMKGTLEEITAMVQKGGLTSGLLVVSPDAALGAYIQGMSRAIVGRRLLNSMKDFDLSPIGEKGKKLLPAVLLTEEFEKLKKAGHFNKQDIVHYETLRHPALEGYKVHATVKSSIDDFFVVASREGIVGTMEKVLRFNNQLKRIAVLTSMFHGSALIMSAIYSLGMGNAIKGIGGKGKTWGINPKTKERELVNWSKLKLGTDDFSDLANEWIGWGLQIVNVKKQELVSPGKVDLDAVFNRFGPAGKFMMKSFDKIDYFTWEYFHDRFKIAAAMKQKEKLMYDWKLDGGKFKRARNNISEEFASREAATFANAAFGSLNWNNFATNLYKYAAANPNKIRGKAAQLAAQALPVNKRRWLNLGLFAPDWTIANIMIIGKTFTGAYKYSKEFLKAFHRGDSVAWKSKEGKELLKAWNMYAAYTIRAGIYTSAMWWLITNKFSTEEPTNEGLFDFWFGEQSGKLDLGDGESVVISKQIGEPVHWIQHPMHTLMNKGAVVPKTLLEAMFNKQWFSLKKGLPLGPRIVDDDGTTHYAEWLLGKGLPIVVKPLIDDDLPWDERIERVMTGFFGFPQFGDPESTTK